VFRVRTHKADAGHAAGRLYADLDRELAPGQVFLDKERLEGGDPWPERLRTEAKRATVMLVLIGERWLKVQDSHTGDRRLNVPDDWVRTEIETGLQVVPVVLPVLVDGAEPLTASTLRTVPSIEKLAKLQALRLRDEDWRSDIQTLMKFLSDRGFEPRANSPLSRSVGVAPVEPTIHEPESATTSALPISAPPPVRKLRWHIAAAVLVFVAVLAVVTQRIHTLLIDPPTQTSTTAVVEEAIVRGTVFDRATQNGIAETQVSAAGVSATTDQSGAFVLVLPRRGSFTLRVEKDGYLPKPYLRAVDAPLDAVQVGLSREGSRP